MSRQQQTAHSAHSKASRLTSRATGQASECRTKYTYDAAGNLNYRTNNALVQTFNVNSLNELSTITRGGTLTVAGTTTSAATNVTVNSSAASLYGDSTFALAGFTVTNGNNTFTAIAKDSVGRADTNSVTVNLPAIVSYTYDLNGNLLSDGTRGFDYDDENQLIRVTLTNSWKSEFVYDGKMRRRIRREFAWVSGAWTQTNEVRCIYDGNLPIQERDINDLPLVTYTRGNDLSGGVQGAGGIGGLLARTDHSTLYTQPPSAHGYYHADGNGNITALINTNQALVAKYLYDPFGGILSQSGPLAAANLYRFSSKEQHLNSGLVYFLCRFYDPNLQRWLNRDPVGEGEAVNLYAYVDCDPVNVVDPLGLTGYPSDFIGPLLPGDVRGPYLPNPDYRPPGWDPRWPTGTDPRGPYSQDPTTGDKWYPHDEDPSHWPHYDNDKGKRFPERCNKPQPNRKRPPSPRQSPKNPWPSPPSQPRPVPPTAPPVIPPRVPWYYYIPMPWFILPNQMPYHPGDMA